MTDSFSLHNATSLPAATYASLEALNEHATLIECCPGQTISRHDDPHEHWYYVIGGVARRCLVLPNGRRQIVDLLLPRDFFGVTAQERHYFTLEAVANRTLVASYARSRVEALAESDPAVAKAVRELALDAIARLQTQLVILGRTTALAKVGSFLINMDERLAHGSANGMVLPMSRYDIADYLAISVETVSRALTTLKRRGVIKFTGSRQLRIVDRAALEHYQRPEKGNASAERMRSQHRVASAGGPLSANSVDVEQSLRDGRLPPACRCRAARAFEHDGPRRSAH
jgi:CRP/FNR family nitrogen fixation transcriptional regulator